MNKIQKTIALMALILMLINTSCHNKSDSHTRVSDSVSNVLKENQSDYDNLYAEFVTNDGRKYSLIKDGTVAELSGDASWWKKDGAIVVFTGEGTSHWTLLDGYLYEGYYEDGQCWQIEWVGGEEGSSEGGLDDVGYIPHPSRGEKLKSLKVYR